MEMIPQNSGFSKPQVFSVISIVGYWPFDEGSGKVAKNASGNGNDGTFVGNPEWVDGKRGKALEFDGTSSYVEVSTADNISMDADVALFINMLDTFAHPDVRIRFLIISYMLHGYFCL